MTERTTAAVPMKHFRCPNGLLVWNAPESTDTGFLYTEIFEQRCYEQHGVTIADGDVIVDVGANIGLFALSAMERFERLEIVCVEPVPDIRACLERNVSESQWRTRHAVTILGAAMGSKNGEAAISYFPQSPANSTMNAGDKRREWADIVGRISFSQLWRLNKFFAFLLLFTFPWRRRVFSRYVAPMFDHAVPVRCEVLTLSETIRQQGLHRVDLLKIDVEGSEMDVLEGIEEQHWPLIQQIAMEISPANKRGLSALEDRLRAVGFTKLAAESMAGGPMVHDDPMPCTLYAARDSR